MSMHSQSDIAPNIDYTNQAEEVDLLIQQLSLMEISCVEESKFMQADRIKHQIEILKKQKRRIQADKRMMTSVCIAQEEQKLINEGIQQFKCKWDDLIRQMLTDFSKIQAQTKLKQHQEMEQLIIRFENDKQNNMNVPKKTVPIPQIVEIQKKLAYYVKTRQYVLAESLKKDIEKIAKDHQHKTQKQIEKKLKAEKLRLKKKQDKQLKVLQIKFQEVLNSKIKYRNQTLQILNKKAKVEKQKNQKMVRNRLSCNHSVHQSLESSKQSSFFPSLQESFKKKIEKEQQNE